jgi:hypothetical protein
METKGKKIVNIRDEEFMGCIGVYSQLIANLMNRGKNE